MKILLNSIVEQLWTKNVIPDYLDSVIRKETNKGSIVEIKELDDEYRHTESMDGCSALHVG